MKHTTRATAVIVAAGLAAMLAAPVSGGPEGTQIVRGNVTIERNGLQTIIRASDGSILNHGHFDIGRDELVRIIQPGETSSVLNRITGAMPTRIEGTLQANGRVYLVNPAGVMFGPNSVVDVGRLYAAAGHMSDADFLAGVDRFTGMSGAVVNEGALRGGQVHLLGRHVANRGTILTPQGAVTMVAGNEILIRQHDDRVTVVVDGADLGDPDYVATGGSNPDLAGDAGVDNTGEVIADGGQIVLGAGDVYSLAIRNAGELVAMNGEITVVGNDGAIHQSGLVDASGGFVEMRGPSVVQSGEVLADAGAGAAGSIDITGRDHVILTSDSLTSASGGAGEAGGGEVIIDAPDGMTVFASGAVIDASGGDAGGDGGFVEVSGGDLRFAGFVDVEGGPASAHGQVLLDPGSIFIEDEGHDDGFLDDSGIAFDEPDETTDLVISDEALEAIVGDIILQATEDIRVNAQLDFIFGNDLTLEAFDDIVIDAPINGLDDFVALADADGVGGGLLLINAPIAADDATFNAHTIFHNVGLFETTGVQTYLGSVDLCVDTTLHAERVLFARKVNATVQGQQSLTVVAPVEFRGPVGNLRRPRSLTVEGPAIIDTHVVRTVLEQTFLGDVIVKRETIFDSEWMGDIRFLGRLDGPGGADVRTGGLTEFGGTAGGIVPLTLIRTDAHGATLVRADLTARVIAFHDPVFLGADALLTGTDEVIFGNTLTGDGFDLTVISPRTTFNARVDDVDALVTDADGETFVNGDVTAQSILFGDDIELLNDVTIYGRDSLDFGSRVNGRFDLVARSDGSLRFAGDVGAARILESLTAIYGDLLVLEGELLQAENDVLLNPAGREPIPPIATIAGLTDELVLRSEHGDILLGRNEKISVLGDLTFEAVDGSVTFGDVNVLGDFAVLSPDIQIWLREPGPVLTFSGETIEDEGTDIIVGGSIVASSSPTLLGEGATPHVATPDGSNIGALLAALEQLGFGDVTREIFFFALTVLDLAVQRQDLPPFTSVAELVTRPQGALEDRIFLDPFALRSMERLAIPVRALDDAELIATLDGREVYDNVSGQAAASPDEREIPVARLRRDSVLLAIERYNEMFETANDESTEDRQGSVRTILAEAWDDYGDIAPGAIDPATFRAYLATQVDHADALTYVDGLTSLFDEIEIMGLTRREIRTSADKVLGPITPANMRRDELERVIGLN